jgi:hypothetical protein
VTEKRKDDRLWHLLATNKNIQSFTKICRKPHIPSSIRLSATILQNPEQTLWTHGIACYVGGFSAQQNNYIRNNSKHNPQSPLSYSRFLVLYIITVIFVISISFLGRTYYVRTDSV